MRPARDILFDFIRSDRDKTWENKLLPIYNKYKDIDNLNILVAGEVDESIYWLAAALSTENLVLYMDIRDVTHTFNYIATEFAKRGYPVKVVYRSDKLLEPKDYSILLSGRLRNPISVVANETIKF